MPTQDNIVAVTENIPTAGAIVWWRLSGGLNVEGLKKAWTDRGLGENLLPVAPSARVAFRRAMVELSTAHRLVRRRPDGGLCLVEEHATPEKELAYDTILKVDLDPVGRLKFDLVKSDVDEEDLRDHYTRHLGELQPEDVSPWLCKLMGSLDAVSLRDTGGIYWVPRFKLDMWRRMLEAIRASTSHLLASVPALSSDEAVSAVLDALEQETQRELAGMEADLSKTGKDALGKRALGSRIAQTEALAKKVAAYEEMLGVRLATFGERASQLSANLSVAILQEDAASDAAE